MTAVSIAPFNAAWDRDGAIPISAANVGAIADPFTPIYRRGDLVMAWMVAAHLVLAAALAPVYGTWRVTAAVGLGAAALYYLSMGFAPGRFVTRNMAGLVLQTFCALHIYQMRGLAEMHFFFFTAVTAMIIYQDWRAMWLGVLAIIAQHTLFSAWHNAGVHPGGQAFFEPSHVSLMKISFHFGIALVQVSFAAYCAQAWRLSTLRAHELATANDRLRDQSAESARTAERLSNEVASLESSQAGLRSLNAQLQHRVTVAEESARKQPVDRRSADVLTRISRELQAPIDSIGSSLDLLEHGIRGPLSIEQLTDLRRIRTGSQQLRGLTEAMIDFAQLETGRTTLSIGVVSVARLLTELKSIMAARSSIGRLQYFSEDCDPSIRAIADPDRTRQIIMNLLSNAEKFTQPGGTVRVGCREISGKVEIWVRDSGQGVSAHEAFLIFEPFVHISREGQPAAHQGLGLGLAISRRLARLMNGELRVKSSKGLGATFTLLLPSAAAGPVAS